jgi:hypothetical protein
MTPPSTMQALQMRGLGDLALSFSHICQAM